MGEAFRLGGWGMYPTTLFGIVLVLAAITYAISPARRRMVVIHHLSVLTLLSSFLGFVTGVIKTCTTVPALTMMEADTPMQHHVVVGVGESLVNVGLGLCLLILTRIILTVGAARASDAEAELLDPRP